MKKNSLKGLIFLFAFSTLSAAEWQSLEEQLRIAVSIDNIKKRQLDVRFN